MPEPVDAPPIASVVDRRTFLTPVVAPVDPRAAAIVREIAADRGGIELSDGIRFETRPVIATYSGREPDLTHVLLRIDETADAVCVVDWPSRDGMTALEVHAEPRESGLRVHPPISGLNAGRFTIEAFAVVRRALVEEASRFFSVHRALNASPLPTGRMAADALRITEADTFADPVDVVGGGSQWRHARALVIDAERAAVEEATRVADLLRRALDHAATAPALIEGGPYGISAATATYSARDGLRRHDVTRDFTILTYDGAPLETAPRLPRLGDARSGWRVSPTHAVRFLIDAAYLIERMERITVSDAHADAQVQRLAAIRLADPNLAERIERRLEAARAAH